MPPAGSATLMSIEAREEPGPADTPVYIWHVSVFCGMQRESLETLYTAIQARFQQQPSNTRIIQILSVVGDDLTDVLHNMFAVIAYHRLHAPAWWQAPGDPIANLLPGGLGGYINAEGQFAQPGTNLRQPEGLFARAWFLKTLATIEGVPLTATVAEAPVVQTPTGELRAGTIEVVKPPAAKPARTTAPKRKPKAKPKKATPPANEPAMTVPPKSPVKAEA